MEELMGIIRDEINVDRDVEVKMISTADRLRQEGLLKGIEKGIQKGRQEGRQEGAFFKALETCKKLLLMGLSPSVVSDATELPLEKVLEIQDSLSSSG
jgi:predicted transposase/invertase (TIGR01784 family)